MNPPEKTITITGYQAFAIGLFKAETQGLLYLLGTCLACSADVAMEEPTEEQKQGILGLLVTVNRNLDEALQPVLDPESSETTANPNESAA